MRLAVEGRYGSSYLWINVWVAGNPSLNIVIPERLY